MPQWIRVLIGEYLSEIKKFGISFRNHFQKKRNYPSFKSCEWIPTKHRARNGGDDLIFLARFGRIFSKICIL